MKRTIKKSLLIFLSGVLIFSLVGCSENNKAKDSNSILFNFEKGVEGWSGDFADLPIDYDKELYELEFKHENIPMKDKKHKGLLLKGHNRSDDLFMYISRKFNKEEGLEPNTKYNVNLSFDMATNVPGGMMGIGGSPGASVYVKAGVTNVEPKSEEKDGYFRMNIDKNNQSTSGKDMIVLGNVEKTDSQDESYQYKSFEGTFQIVTNENGEAWAIIGTDSGFEGLTELYYTNIKFEFNKVTE